MYYLKKDQPQAPDIALRRVLISLQDLRSHIVGSAHECLVHVVGGHALGKPKISQLQHFIPNEDVLGFYVPVNDSMGNQLMEAQAQLLQKASGNVDRIFAIPFHPFPQVALTQFLHDVVVAVGLENVEDLDHMF